MIRLRHPFLVAIRNSRKTILAGLGLVLFLAACGSDTPASQTPDETQNRPERTERGSSYDFSGITDINAFFECLESEGKSIISAHRAGSYPDYPENALETAQFVSSRIPAMHEIDVATSRDGVLFLLHDDTLDRTTTGEGDFADLDWADIRNLQLEDKNGRPTSFNPPTLESFLRWARGRALVQIDFKRSTRYEDVVALVEKLKAQPRVIYIAYSMAAARKLHRLAPEAMISVSVDSMSELNAATASGIPMDRLIAFTGTSEPRPRFFSILNDRDVEVIFGTLGGRESIDREIARTGNNDTYTDLSKFGVDIIATDRPLEANLSLADDNRAIDAPVCGLSR